MKVRENRVRRMAERQGLILEKSRRRDPKAKDYGMFRLLVNHRDLEDHRATTPFAQRLDDIETLLTSMDDD